LTFTGFAIVFMAMVSAQDKPERIRYVAIGDSYSIGEGALLNESWPALLTRHLQEKGFPIELVANPSRTGWTTKHAIEFELPILSEVCADFATLQIGVNDWVQGVDTETFRKSFAFLVDRMTEVIKSKQRLLIVTIPDFGVTPAGPRYSGDRDISEGIAAYNKIIVEEATRRGLRVVDVFPLSKKMGQEPSLVAKDELHPSAKEYAEWEAIIFPVAQEGLRRPFDRSPSP
jgi:lysophospholipase L1-like esterase